MILKAQEGQDVKKHQYPGFTDPLMRPQVPQAVAQSSQSPWATDAAMGDGLHRAASSKTTI